MYSLLIIDDEIFTVRGMVESIQWSDIGICEIFSAYNALKALEIINSREIDVIVCDIEMNGLNGIELLERIREKQLNIATIFLTGHAKFDYAQKAVKLGCFDYLLKPIEHNKIKNTVKNALKMIEEEEIKNKFFETYKGYYNLWEKQRPILVERFWQDIFSGRYLDTNWIREYIDLYEMTITVSTKVTPILISVEEWEISLNARDEEVMKYAIRRVAEELLLNNYTGMVFQNHDGNNIIIVYEKENNIYSRNKLREYCKQVKEICREKLHSLVSCYIGRAELIKDLNIDYIQLLEIEKNNINQVNSVVILEEYKNKLIDIIQSPPFHDWKILFSLGKGQKLCELIHKYFHENSYINFESLENFNFGLLHMIYEVFHQKGISIKKVYDLEQYSKIFESNSITVIEKRIRNIVMTGVKYINNFDDSDSTVLIKKIKSYIKDNYMGSLNRKEIAIHVSLNPAYLSRFFKKETGQTLTEYITELRLDESKKILSETDLTITLIAEKIGYKNYSYFSKIFKERFGITPNEYKRTCL